MIPRPLGFTGRWMPDHAHAGPWATATSGPFRIPPSAVALPSGVDDLHLLIRSAAAEGWALTARGAGTGRPAGNLGTGVVVDLSGPGWGEIGRPDPERGTLRVGAGAVAAAVEDTARRAGLRFPPLPSSAAWATIGGMIGTNAAGARSFRHGAMREWIESLELILADGSSLHLGPGDRLPEPVATRLPSSFRSPLSPALRKNSSGYALDRYIDGGNDPRHLIVGSEGTLAFVTAATLKLLPAPGRRVVGVLPLPQLDFLPEASRVAREAGATACEFLGRRILELVRGSGTHPVVPEAGPETAALLIVEFEGPEGSDGWRRAEHAWRASLGVRPRGARDEEEADALWALRHAASPLIQEMAARGIRSVQLIEDGSVPPEALPGLLCGIGAAADAFGIDFVAFGHAGDGNAHVNLLVDPSDPRLLPSMRGILDRTAELTRGLGGTLAGEHGDGRLRAPMLERIWGADAVGAFRTVKEAFDPVGILNPGVILPLEGQDPLEGFLGAAPSIGPGRTGEAEGSGATLRG